MSEEKNKDYEELFKRIKVLSNKKKFDIVLLTQNKAKNITELSKELKLAYNKCSDYVSYLAKKELVLKVKEGKEVYVRSNITLSKDDLKEKKSKKRKK